MNVLTDEEVQFFRDQGYLLQRAVFSAPEIDRLRQGYLPLIYI